MWNPRLGVEINPHLLKESEHVLADVLLETHEGYFNPSTIPPSLDDDASTDLLIQGFVVSEVVVQSFVGAVVTEEFHISYGIPGPFVVGAR